MTASPIEETKEISYLIAKRPEEEKPPSTSMESLVNIHNHFNTHEVRPWHRKKGQTRATKKIMTTTSHTPSFAVGLTSFDIGPPRNVRVAAYVGLPPSPDFKVYIDTWDDTVLYSASCTWLEIGPTDRDLQCGTWGITDEHAWDAPQLATSARITFLHPYTETPKVIVWLAAINVGGGTNMRVHVHASDIDAEGFTVHADTWSDTILHDARVWWIAHPADRSNITSGVFGTQDVRTWETPRSENEGEIVFDRAFKAPPRVYAAFNFLDIGTKTDVCVGMSTGEVSKTGVKWEINGRADTVIYTAAGSYIAIQEF